MYARRKIHRNSRNDRLRRCDAACAMACHHEGCADDAGWQAELWCTCTEGGGRDNTRPSGVWDVEKRPCIEATEQFGCGDALEGIPVGFINITTGAAETPPLQPW